MATCPYHGNPTPCRTCLEKKMGEFAHAHPRKDACPYHGKPHPCIDCFDKNMGQFARRPVAAPIRSPTVAHWAPPIHGHTHGTDRPCNIRCGANEALCILNSQANVSELFTDGLIGCTQVILRNATATLTCHIFTGASAPKDFILLLFAKFVDSHGTVDHCYVISGDGTGAADTIETALRGKNIPNIGRIRGCGGYAISIANGTVRETPGGWNTSQSGIAGWLTASVLIHTRYTAIAMLGEPMAGDYYEPCAACNT